MTEDSSLNYGVKNIAKNSLLGLSNMSEAEKTAEGNGEGLSLRLQKFSKKTIRLDLELGISIKVHIQNSLFSHPAS